MNYLIEVLRNKKTDSVRSKADQISEAQSQEEEEKEINTNLIFLVQSDGSGSSAHSMIIGSRIFDLISESSINYDPQQDDASKRSNDKFLSMIPDGVRIITSDLARLGKTHHIQTTAAENKSHIIEFFITGDLNTENLRDRLLKF